MDQRIKIPSNINLIGISGRAGSGKDTVAEWIYDHYQNAWTIAFADALKESAAVLFGVVEDNFHDQDLKNNLDPFWQVTNRQLLQFFGTEMVRETFTKLVPEVGKDFWIWRLCKELNLVGLDPGDTFIIPDVRFQNEYDWIIQNNGIVIHLTRPGDSDIVGLANHASESGFNFTEPRRTYHVNNNKTLTELFFSIEDVLNKADTNVPLIKKIF